MAVAAVFGTSSVANAGFQVTFKVDALSQTIVDGGAGDNDGLANNKIVVVSQTVGTYDFNVTLTTTNSPGGTISFVNHSTSEISGTGAATVQIIASANGFTSPAGSIQATSGGTFQFLAPTPSGNTADVSYNAYIDTNNLLASTAPAGTLIGAGGPVTITSPIGNSTQSDVQFGTFGQPYTLTLQLKGVLNSDSLNSIDMDGTLRLESVTPAPAGFLLALSGIPVLGVGAWLRRRQNPTAV